MSGLDGPSVAAVRSARLASVVIFVQNLELSENFYGDCCGCRSQSAIAPSLCSLGSDEFQLYLRAMGPHAQHTLGSVGVQYVIWTAADEEDLRRCEHFLKERSAHVFTQTADGFTLVEGRDPSDVPVMVTYPGPIMLHDVRSCPGSTPGD
jgi:hypothetical protein